MTLRARLTLFFAAIVVVPLLAATFALQSMLSGEAERRANTRLEAAARAVAAAVEDRLELAAREAERAAARLEGAVPAARLEAQRRRAGVDFLLLTGPTGRIRGAAVGEAELSGRVVTPPPATAASGGPTGAVSGRASLRDGGRVVAGWFVDDGFLRDLEDIAGVSLALHREGEVVARGAALESADGETATLTTPLAGGRLVLSVPREEGRFGGMLWVVALLALAMAVLLTSLLAGLVAQPVDRLASAARAVAAGRLDTRIEERGPADVGRLAHAFNAMVESLRRHVEETEGSRDELRRTLDRLGATLRSTLDLDGMLRVILEAAAATLRAAGGAVFLSSPSGGDLRLTVAHGIEVPEGATLRAGEGIAGTALQGRPVRVPSRMERAPRHASVEPPATTAVAVPLMRGERVMGVLSLYGRTAPGPFSEEDAATLASFAGQAAVAIENVLLHQEARRLSITDGLTGVWNRRYLTLTLGSEIQRAQRFARPLSLLLLDIDRFKEVNDVHGHLVGDEVLVEVSRRIMRSIRAGVDMLVRYGGEEFVAVLPETPRAGALVAAEKVRSIVADEPFSVDDGRRRLGITVSIGVACFPEDGSSPGDLLRVADAALYRAKEAGRDRIAEAGSG